MISGEIFFWPFIFMSLRKPAPWDEGSGFFVHL